jgi:hypothetical protein
MKPPANAIQIAWERTLPARFMRKRPFVKTYEITALFA